MVVNIHNKVLLKKLKKQVKLLQAREAKAKNQLQVALKKARKLSRSYKSQLASKMRVMKSKLEQAQILTYAKAVANLERQLLKSMEKKTKALATVASRIEKTFTLKLAKKVSPKTKKKPRPAGVKKQRRKHVARSSPSKSS